ncbi:MAG: hypothetical protein ABJE10_06430 [bacterium]
MSKYIRGLRMPLALSLALVFAACTASEKSKTDSALANDPSLNKDLQLAGRDTTTQPALKDVPAAPAEAAPAPKSALTKTPPMRTTPAPKPRVTTPPPKPAPTPTTTASGNTVTTNPSGSASTSGGGSVGTIASGTTLALRSNERICTNTHHVGSTFTATLANAVTGSNGSTIPAGATVSLEVTNLKRSENANDHIVMEFAVKSVNVGGKTYPVSASVASADVDKVRNEPKAKDAQKVVGGAVIGAIAGQILGKSTKGTLIGAAAGAAAGAGVAAGTANYEGCLPDGGNVSVTLNSPLQIRITS